MGKDNLTATYNKYKGIVFGNLTTNLEKAEFFECGRAHETGIIAHAMVEEIALLYREASEAKRIVYEQETQKIKNFLGGH